MHASVTWDEVPSREGREGGQRPGGEGRREALLARWLQEGNKRLRERLGAGLARTSDPGPQPNSSSGKAERPTVRLSLLLLLPSALLARYYCCTEHDIRMSSDIHCSCLGAQLLVLKTQATLQRGETASRRLNGSAQGEGAHDGGAHAMKTQVADSDRAALPIDTQRLEGQKEPLPASSVVAQPTEQALRDKAVIEAQQAGSDANGTAIRSTGRQQAPEPSQPPQHVGSSSSRAEQVLEPSQPSGKADGSRAEQAPQQGTEAKASPEAKVIPKAVPRLKIPLSPRPPTAHELPSTRASQSESARSKPRAHEPSPDEGWSPRQVHAPPLELSASCKGIHELCMQGSVLLSGLAAPAIWGTPTA